MSNASTDAVTQLGEARALPRADAANVRALNRLYGAAPLPDVATRGLRYRIHWNHDAAFGHTTRESYRFRLGAHVGHLAMDAPSLQALLGERRIDLLPRDLRYILLADALHPVVDALEKALRLHFEWQPSEVEARHTHEQQERREHAPLLHCDPERAAFFAATPSDGGAMLRGFVQFEDAATLDTLVPAGRAPHHNAHAGNAFDALRLPVNFRLGSTPIQLREISSIRPGDIVGIEQWRSSGAAVVVTAELGGPAGRHLTAFAEGSRITVQQSRDSAMKPDTPAATADAADNANLPIDRLDALEVTLRFEVGELSLSLGELKSIRAGHVFDLGQPLNRSPVRILAHGNVLGKGYLVAVGDRLGVRVSEFAPGEV